MIWYSRRRVAWLALAAISSVGAMTAVAPGVSKGGADTQVRAAAAEETSVRPAAAEEPKSGGPMKTGCERPPVPAIQYATAPDPNICLAVAADRGSYKPGEVVNVTLSARNEGLIPVDISHPSACEIWYGVFQTSDDSVFRKGEWVGGGPDICAGEEHPDVILPGQVREWTVQVDGEFGANFENAGLAPGTYTLAIGINVSPAPAGRAVGQVWYARTATVTIGANTL
jgi:hypothetical protein